MCYRVIRDAKRRTSGYAKPRAEDDQCPAYYGVDFVSNNGSRNGGKLVCQYTVHEGMKTLKMKSAPADRRPSRERFYGIDDRDCAKGKVVALAQIPGGGGGRNARIVFGIYDSKVEVSIQEKHRISEVVVARFEEHNVERAEAEKPLPPLHVAGACTSSAEFLSLFDESEVEMAAAMFDSRPIEIARPLLFESEEGGRRAEPAAPKRKRKSRKKKRKAAAAAAAAAAERATSGASGRRREPAAAPGARRGARRAPPTAPPVEAPAEAPPPAAAPAKKKKKKRSRRRARAARRDQRVRRTRMRNIAAGNKKLYSLGLIHPPPEVVADPEHSWWSERARTRVFLVSRLRRALPQAQS
ncbi:hypothetical protein JL722_5389 [Aureococcus anophagefferens]|nr:hypothetical protein JL722_5389 [Aureococcus anophagefferens]